MLIKNGTIHDGLGFAGQRDLRIESGLITGLGESLPIREGEEVFDAAGMEVLPGFIQTISNWGVNGSAYEIRPLLKSMISTATPSQQIRVAFTALMVWPSTSNNRDP